MGHILAITVAIVCAALFLVFLMLELFFLPPDDERPDDDFSDEWYRR